MVAYTFEINRNSDINAQLTVQEDDTLVLTDADSGKDIKYLIEKLNILRELVRWCRENDVHKVELTQDGY